MSVGGALSFGVSDQVDLQFRALFNYDRLSLDQPSPYEETDLSGSVDATVRWLPTAGTPRFYVGAGPQAAYGSWAGTVTVQDTELEFEGKFYSLAAVLEAGLLLGSEDALDVGIRGAVGASNCLESGCKSASLTIVGLSVGRAF